MLAYRINYRRIGMVQGLVMCIMMAVIAIVASMIHRFVIAKRTQGKENIQFVRSVFFFFFCFYFLISLTKWYLGSPDNTLIERAFGMLIIELIYIMEFHCL